MTVPPSDALLKGSTFFALLQEGFTRMLSVVKSDKFEVVVNGESFETTLAEAVLISPKVYELLQIDPTIRTFTICSVDESEAVDSSSFQTFLDCVHLREFFDLSRSNELTFLTICRLLGNERLSFLFLASLNSISRAGSATTSTSSSTSNSTSTSSSEVSISGEVLVNLISSSQATIDYCASQFYRYSVDEIRQLDKHTLHLLLQSRSLRVSSEDDFLGFLNELGPDYCEFWCYIEPIFLTSEGISLFGNSLPFDYVNESIWQKVFVRIANKPDESIRKHCFASPVPSVQRFESNIVETIPSIFKDFDTKSWRLLYRGTRDGFGTANFHSKCDQQSNTVTIILTTGGYIFGGFTPLAWDSSGTYRADSTGKSFLFSLKNPRNTEPKIFPLSTASRAIYCNASYVPTFGGGHDVYVAPNCDQNTSNYTNFGSDYKNDTGINGQQVFTGGYKFQVREIEVFSISS
jgi:hypothetical protein